MKKLSIFKENDQFVIEHIDEFNHATKQYFSTENDLLKGLSGYQDVMSDYELDVTEDLWAKVINFLTTGNEIHNTSSTKTLLSLHKKMYDVRWNGADENIENLEKELVSLAESEGISLEKVNEMLQQLYIPPYQDERLPDYLKRNHGGKREGAGRPSLGTTKKISITLPDSIWEEINDQKGSQSMSAYLRELLINHFR